MSKYKQILSKYSVLLSGLKTLRILKKNLPKVSSLSSSSTRRAEKNPGSWQMFVDFSVLTKSYQKAGEGLPKFTNFLFRTVHKCAYVV